MGENIFDKLRSIQVKLARYILVTSTALIQKRIVTKKFSKNILKKI